MSFVHTRRAFAASLLAIAGALNASAAQARDWNRGDNGNRNRGQGGGDHHDQHGERHDMRQGGALQFRQDDQAHVHHDAAPQFHGGGPLQFRQGGQPQFHTEDAPRGFAFRGGEDRPGPRWNGGQANQNGRGDRRDERAFVSESGPHGNGGERYDEPRAYTRGELFGRDARRGDWRGGEERRGDWVRNHGADHAWGRGDWDRGAVRRFYPGRYFARSYADLCGRYFHRRCVLFSDGWWGPWNRPWRVGYVLPDDVDYWPIPYDLYEDLPPCPYGYDYCQVEGGDIILLSLLTGVVIDAILFA